MGSVRWTSDADETAMRVQHGVVEPFKRVVVFVVFVVFVVVCRSADPGQKPFKRRRSLINWEIGRASCRERV